MCHESSGAALTNTLGIGKGSVRLTDLYEAELIIVMGQNPGTNHPRMLSALERCKENGGRIISVNPLREAGLVRYINPQKPIRVLTGGIELADLHLSIPINRDLAFLKSILLLLWQRELSGEQIFDRLFIEEQTEGYEEFITNLEQYNLDDCIAESGIPRDQVYQAAQMIASAKKK